MSSLVKTLCRWYSTVRGLMNSRAAISGSNSFAGQQCDLPLLTRQRSIGPRTRLRTVSPVAGSSRGHAPRTLRHQCDEHLVRGAEMFAGVGSPVLAAEPFAVDQCAGRDARRCDYGRAARSPPGTSRRQPRRRTATRVIEPRSRVPIRCRSRGPVPGVRRAEARQRRGAAAAARLDELDQRPGAQTRDRRVRTLVVRPRARPGTGRIRSPALQPRTPRARSPCPHPFAVRRGRWPRSAPASALLAAPGGEDE